LNDSPTKNFFKTKPIGIFNDVVIEEDESSDSAERLQSFKQILGQNS
jgi:hypothetical protein